MTHVSNVKTLSYDCIIKYWNAYQLDGVSGDLTSGMIFRNDSAGLKAIFGDDLEKLARCCRSGTYSPSQAFINFNYHDFLNNKLSTCDSLYAIVDFDKLQQYINNNHCI